MEDALITLHDRQSLIYAHEDEESHMMNNKIVILSVSRCNQFSHHTI